MRVKKVRVYELARELEIESRDLVNFLVDLGADVKNHMSTVDYDIAEMVKQHFLGTDEEEIDDDKSIKTKKQRPKKQKKRLDEEKSDDKVVDKIAKNAKVKANKVDQVSDGQRKKVPSKASTLELPEAITLKDLASKLEVSPAEIIKKLMLSGVMLTVNQPVDYDTAAKICAEYNINVSPIKDLADTVFEDSVEDDPSQLLERPPVVTIMGHVDHGKTTLLDSIRKSKLTASEAGGITQHIGAYQVDYNGKKITFLDTPGHAAFTAMRARGAQVTDIAVLVVASDDGVMPQTVEAINHAKAAKVPVIVAINKMDRPNANPDRIKQELSEYNLVPEDWGGDTIIVEMSALRYEGVDELLEMITLVSEIEEFKANPNRLARGTVVEAKLDKGRGPVATVLITTGTLKVGDNFAVGNVSGRVRALIDDRGKNIKQALPSQPVEIVGISDVPEAGDVLVVTKDEQTARNVAQIRQLKQREHGLRGSARASLDDLFIQIQEGQVKELNLVIKADVQGSLEALRAAFEKLSTDEVRINVVHQGVGGVSETDVQLATASGAIIIGFNVRPEPNAERAADKENVEIRYYRVIYDAINEVKAAMSGLLTPDYKEETIGRAQVRQTFKVPDIGTVAGSYVTDGKITRSAKVRIVRDSVVVHEGKISSLKRFKDDVREVVEGYECGIGVERFNDIKEDDVIEAFVIREIARSL